MSRDSEPDPMPTHAGNRLWFWAVHERWASVNHMGRYSAPFSVILPPQGLNSSASGA